MKSPWQDESIAPNGCPVKENFGRWFGDSVVTENDKPRVMYHGTDTDFDVFEVTEDIGYHFGSVKCATSRLEQIGYEDGRLLEVHLAISNPLRLRDLHTWGSNAVARALRDAGLLSAQQADEFAEYNDLEMVRDLLMQHSYDGIVYDPRKIKLAKSNSGLFEPESPSMSDGNAALFLHADRALSEARVSDRLSRGPR